MDHAAGTVKSTIKRETAAGEFLIEVKGMVEFLQSQFSTSVWPIHIIKELEEKDLLEKRELSWLRVFKQLMVQVCSKWYFLHQINKQKKF